MLRLIAFAACMLCTSLVFATPFYAPLCMVVGASQSSGAYAYPLCPSNSGGVIWYDIAPTVNGQQADAQNISSLTSSLNTTNGKVNTNTSNISSLQSSVSTLQSQVAALQADLATRTTADQGDQLISIMQYLGMGIATFLGFATRIA